MFKSQNFCHIASNNRNQVKAGVFVYRTTDDLATVSVSGYFNDRIIDINLHDIIIHEKVNAIDNTKVEQNILCVTERTLSNIGTTVVKSKWEGEVDTALNQIQQIVDALPNTYVKIDGSSIMSAPLKFKAGSLRGAIGPTFGGVEFYTLNNDSPTYSLVALGRFSTNGFLPHNDNTYDIGSTARHWKDAYIGRVITSVLNNGYDIAVPVTNSADTLALKSEVDLAANSGRMITDQGVWYAKMYAGTTAPSAEDGTNYADFSQTDGQGNPIIVIYERQSGAWVQSETITPPAEYDGYVPITSKIWDIAEQTGQQGGRVLWNHQSKEFTPYPQIISFDNIEVTGDSTVVMPLNPSGNQIVNKDYVDSHTSDGGYHPELLSFQWSDHEIDDMQWLESNTFSWQDGTVYEEAYNHLAEDYNNVEITRIFSSTSAFYTRSAEDDDLQRASPYAWKQGTTIVYTEKAIPDLGDTIYMADDSIEGTVATYTKRQYTETIAGITISYFLAADGHKICFSSGQNDIEAIFAATGTAWYYIFDNINHRFKLPRSKHNKYEETLGVIGNGSGMRFVDLTQGGTTNIAYKSGDLFGFSDTPTSPGVGNNHAAGLVSDASLSGVIAEQAEDTDQYKYLYFYVGSFTQTALENTAGLNASLFNNKVDIGHEVIAFQAPTSQNNYTWYRKYRDGWVEQGGFIWTDTDAEITITLPVTMTNNSYNVLFTRYFDSSSSGGIDRNYSSVWTKTTTNFKCWGKWGGSTGLTWEVKGIAA